MRPKTPRWDLLSTVACGNVRQGRADIAALEECLRVIGGKIAPGCLVLIETTVPPGTTQYVAYPIIKKAFQGRGIEAEPLLAHSFERVMPGKNYVSSIRDFWRVCSGVNEASGQRVQTFLSDVLNVEEYPLTVLETPRPFMVEVFSKPGKPERTHHQQRYDGSRPRGRCRGLCRAS